MAVDLGQVQGHPPPQLVGEGGQASTVPSPPRGTKAADRKRIRQSQEAAELSLTTSSRMVASFEAARWREARGIFLRIFWVGRLGLRVDTGLIRSGVCIGGFWEPAHRSPTGP